MNDVPDRESQPLRVESHESHESRESRGHETPWLDSRKPQQRHTTNEPKHQFHSSGKFEAPSKGGRAHHTTTLHDDLPSLVLMRRVTMPKLDLQRSTEACAKSPLDEPLSSASQRIRLDSKKVSIINTNLLLGSNTVAANAALLKKHNVTHVLNAAGVACPNHHPDLFTYKTLFLYDMPEHDISTELFTAIEYIDHAIKTGGTVFIHCHQGVSRSATCAIAYLMWRYATSYDEASQRVKAARDTASPNPGFIATLLTLEGALKRAAAPASTAATAEPPRLFRIAPWYGAPRAVPVTLAAPVAGVLDPRGAFVLDAAGKLFVWVGSRAHPTFVAAAHKWASQLHRFEKCGEPRTECQDAESELFWSAAGGERAQAAPQTEYDADYGTGKPPVLPSPELPKSPKSPAAVAKTPRGRQDDLLAETIIAEMREKYVDPANDKVANPAAPHLYAWPEWKVHYVFDTDDLTDDGAFVLLERDTALSAFVWVGKEAPKQPREIWQHFCQEKKLPTGVNVADVNVALLHQGAETPEFWRAYDLGELG